jgi:hypothetical protein
MNFCHAERARVIERLVEPRLKFRLAAGGGGKPEAVARGIPGPRIDECEREKRLRKAKDFRRENLSRRLDQSPPRTDLPSEGGENINRSDDV